MDWLVDELAERYYVPRKLAQAWTDAEQVLPLLDGLDEVAPEHRAACVEAINTFRRQHALVPLAVCSRVADYEALPVRVALSGAVVIQRLSRTQISSYLKQAGKALVGVRTVLGNDETLWELLETPLMLSIVALAYQGRSAAEVRATGSSLKQRRTHLFENYTRRMFERRSKVSEYTREQTLCWLTWLARALMRNNLGVFYVERMQPDWLPSLAQQLIVAIVPIIFFGLVAALISGLVFGGLVAPLISGLAMAAMILAPPQVHGITPAEDGITPVEALRWSWRSVQQRNWLSIWLGTALTGGLAGVVALIHELPKGLGTALTSGLVFGLFMLLFGLLFGLTSGVTTDKVVTRTIPNEGIRRSLRNAVISVLTIGLLVGLPLGLVAALTGGLLFGLTGGLRFGLLFGLTSGLVVGLPLGLVRGGVAYIKHYTLRILLWRNDYAPWNYIRFLDYAAERIFLRKVGGGYTFYHPLLMEYFATLQPTDQAGQTQSA